MYWWNGVTFASLLTLTGIGHAKPHIITVCRAQWLMGTVCEIQAEGGAGALRLQASVTAAFDEIARLDRIMSSYKDNSELMQLNHRLGRAPIECSPDLFAVLDAGRHIAHDTGGAFDITVGGLFGPTQRAHPVWGMRHLTLDAARRTAHAGTTRMALDLGGIGKGYALDRAADLLLSQGVSAALLNFGGQLLATAPASHPGWTVTLASCGDAETLERLTLLTGSVATSSNDERPHVRDPRSGTPAAFRGSVSVWAPTATAADAYSTALLVMGREAGMQWITSRRGMTALFLERHPDGTCTRTASPGWRGTPCSSPGQRHSGGGS